MCARAGSMRRTNKSTGCGTTHVDFGRGSVDSYGGAPYNLIMNDARWAKMMGTKQINRAAQRREHAAERAAAIAKLGMAPEILDQGHGEMYAATTGELIAWARGL